MNQCRTPWGTRTPTQARHVGQSTSRRPRTLSQHPPMRVVHSPQVSIFVRRHIIELARREFADHTFARSGAQTVPIWRVLSRSRGLGPSLPSIAHPRGPQFSNDLRGRNPRFHPDCQPPKTLLGTSLTTPRYSSYSPSPNTESQTLDFTYSRSGPTIRSRPSVWSVVPRPS